MKPIAESLAALVCGAIFGFGLALSGMLDPARVRGFLDLFGHFDPSLAFVLVGAVTVSAAGYVISRRMRTPMLGGAFHIPRRRIIDGPLVLGSAIFGVGWGMGGLCPGPGIAVLALGLFPAFVFAAALIAGVLLHDYGWSNRRKEAQSAPHPVVAREAIDE